MYILSSNIQISQWLHKLLFEIKKTDDNVLPVKCAII